MTDPRDDALATARAERPQDRLVAFHDSRPGASFVMAVPPTSPWYALLPEAQKAEIRAA